MQLLPGSLVELPEETAKMWIASGHAQRVVETAESQPENIERAVLPNTKKSSRKAGRG